MELYTKPSSFEPLLPSIKRAELAELTCDIHRHAGALSTLLPSPAVRQRLALLVHEMNSYYSNLIEGHKTYPREIEQALRQDYSSKPAEQANQHLARAHIEVEQLMRQRLAGNVKLNIHTPEFICWLHHEFYNRLPESLHFSEKENGEKYHIEIGALRTHEVTIGRHQPPHFGSLQAFMQRFDEFYGSQRILPTNQLIALAAAHHRLAWVHPFGDGNGRVARLHTQAWLIQCKVDSGGLWTISRGLARAKEDYYQHLHSADSVRLNDFDGRGNLSDQGLADFCVFFLKCILDQIQFMTGLLDLHNLARRMEAHLHIAHANWSARQREQVGRILKEALIEGQVERGEVPRIIGRKATTASAIIGLALKAGLVESPDSSTGPLRLVFDSRVLETYFPKLYQDLPG